MISWYIGTVSENQGTPIHHLGVRRTQQILHLWGLPAAPEGGNGVFLRVGRREQAEARKKYVPQTKLPVARTRRPL